MTEAIFDEDAGRDIQIILLMRLYDILMSQFILEHPEEGSKLYDLHKVGGFLNPPPAYDPSQIIE